MSVVVPDLIMDDSSESTPSYLDDEAFDLSPNRQLSLSLARSRVMDDELYAVRRDREKEGRCGECGMHTHQWAWNPLNQAPLKVPLTIPHEVHRGRCLLCYPLPEVISQGLQLGETSTPSGGPEASKSFKAKRRISDFGFKAMAEQVLDAKELDDPSVRIAMKAMEEADICDVLHVMKCVPHIGSLQALACEKLWVLTWDDDNATSIGRVGGVALIAQAMERFPHNARLQQCACEALQNLAAHEGNRCDIIESGGIALIVRAMVCHHKSAEIQKCACSALANLACEYPQDVCRVGGLHAVVHAARRFNQETGVVRAAYDAVLCMGVDPRGHLPVLAD
jgi:hypothetical protein